MNRSILIDSDVISHFISGGMLTLLPDIFPENKILLLDKVYEELERYGRRKPFIDLMISKGSFELFLFPEDDQDIKKEYAYIMKSLFKGNGESACMAVARFHNEIIGSSNLKDIRQYCNLHSIDYLTTMDFLCAALKCGLLSSKECNDFISKVIRAGSKLPVIRMKDHKCRDLGFVSRNAKPL
jgi:hypothetical protein